MHSDWITLLPDKDGLHDARVMQLSVDQVHVKHSWLLRKQTYRIQVSICYRSIRNAKHCEPAHIIQLANLPYVGLAWCIVQNKSYTCHRWMRTNRWINVWFIKALYISRALSNWEENQISKKSVEHGVVLQLKLHINRSPEVLAFSTIRDATKLKSGKSNSSSQDRRLLQTPTHTEAYKMPELISNHFILFLHRSTTPFSVLAAYSAKA